MWAWLVGGAGDGNAPGADCIGAGVGEGIGDLPKAPRPYGLGGAIMESSVVASVGAGGIRGDDEGAPAMGGGGGATSSFSRCSFPLSRHLPLSVSK